MFKFEELESNIMTIQEMAIQGDTESQYELGFCYKEGIGIPQNYQEAFKWLKKAALADHTKAQGMLALCYYLGRGVSENDEKAEICIKTAKEEATDSDDIEFINTIIGIINDDGIIYIEPIQS